MHLRLLSNGDKSQQPATVRAAFVSAMLVLSMMSSGCSIRNGMPADEDALVSYLQSVSSLAKQLKLKFDDKSNRASISGLVQQGALNSDDRIKASFDEVKRYNEAVSAIPTDTRKRLYQFYHELVRTTQAECEQLMKLNAKKPQLLANDWDRYWQAMSSVNRPDR